MTALPDHPLMSVEEYLQLDRSSLEARYEYIDGYVTMLAGGTLDHATIGANMISLLRGALRGSPCHVFTSDAKVRLSETRYVYPDITISCDSRERGSADMIEYPRIVVEILSPSTEDYDRGRKFLYYRRCLTIHEYVLVNTAYPAVEVCRREKNDFWSFQTFGFDNQVELASVGMHFSVADVYEDIFFPVDDNPPV